MSEAPLTLGQASSYVTGAVEYLEIASSEWKPFDPSIPVAPNIVLNWQFRLRRPRKTRLQTMARDWDKPTITFDQVAAFGEAAIRSVCEWLRAESRLGFERNPDAIEREFLEPR